MEHGEMVREGVKRPRVAIIGAGLAGLSAACRLKSAKSAELEVIVLEGSHRIGGRICTSEIAGERVELGATWIHGIEGSPLYEIAEQSGAFKGDIPWECMDGFPARPIVKLEGGHVVDQSIFEPVGRLYKKLFTQAQEQYSHQLKGSSTNEPQGSSLGSFLKMGLKEFLSEQGKPSENGVMGSCLNDSQPKKANGEVAMAHSSGWSLSSLIKGVFSIHEISERAETGADCLYNLDLPSFGEYWEFRGEHVTIAKGFSSVVHSLASVLPPGTIRFGKVVQAIRWNNQSATNGWLPVHLHCQDGSVIEADHVIITVSLGVLKACTTASRAPSDAWRSDTLQDFKHSCKAQAFRGNNVENLIQAKGIAHHAELFQPPLPPWKVEAIQKLGFGVVDKVFTLVEPVQGDSHSHMQFIYKSASDQQNSAIPSWMRKTCALYPIYSKSHILLAWFVGKEALEMEALSGDTISKAITTTLSEFGYCKKSSNSSHFGAAHKRLPVNNGNNQEHFADVPPRRTCNSNGYHPHYRIKHSKWGTDPLFMGSYSYIATGSSGADIDVLAEPLPRESSEQFSASALQLLFAGEATHRYHYSTTHGAYFSGMREADRLLKHYGWLT